MKPKHILTLVVLVLAILSGGAIITQAQGPVPPPTMIPPPATYDGSIGALQAPPTVLPPPAAFPDELRAQAADTPEKQMVDLMNQARVSQGLFPLVINTHLTQAALNHSQDMADHGICGHEGSNGSSPWARIPGAGYVGSLGGEVIACGQTSVQQAFDAWRNSPGHWAIILGQYGEVGFGWVTKPGTPHVNYFTADFGGSPGKTTPGSNPGPVVTNTPIPFLKTPTPYIQPTATVPWWLLPTPTVPFYLPTATPIPQPGVGGWQIILWCDAGGVNCRVVAQGPR